MLVLFKANTLLQLQTPIQPEQSEELLQTEHETRSKRLYLEQQLRRRPAALPPQKRRVTLQELIQQLQLMATQLQSPATDNTHKRQRGLHSQSRAALVIAQLAHQENLTEVAGELEQFFNRRSNHLPLEQDWLNLEQLVHLWTQGKRSNSSSSPSTYEDLSDISSSDMTGMESSQRSAGESSDYAPATVQSHRYDRVSVFWALLLLSAQSKVELSQEEFYQEIKVRTAQSAS